MAKYIGMLIIFSLLLILGNSKPSKRKHRDSDADNFEEKIEETISEERNETLVTVLTKFNDFYTDILPELRLTLVKDCEDENLNLTATKQELTPATSLDCLTLDAVACAASLKKQFNEKVKEEYVREITIFISKTFEIYAAISRELPENDPHEKGIEKFLLLISTDLPKLNTAIDLDLLDRMFKAMHDGMKPNFSDTQIDDESNKLYESLVEKHSSELPSIEELNGNKIAYINKIWNELVEDLRAVELFKRLETQKK